MGAEGNVGEFADLEALRPALTGLAEGAQLLAAATIALAQSGLASTTAQSAASLHFSTTIPREVGLSGSSAIVISALRAVAGLWQVQLNALDVARLALVAETELLGITAGPQDRVVQSYGGVLDMAFDVAWDPSRYRRISADLVPNSLMVLIDPGSAVSSDVVHTDIRGRFDAGDPEVTEAMVTFAALAADGAHALRSRDLTGLADLVDTAYDTRASIWHITERDRQMMGLARAHNAAAAFAGSGGAMVCVPRPSTDIAALRREAAALDIDTRALTAGPVLAEPAAGIRPE